MGEADGRGRLLALLALLLEVLLLEVLWWWWLLEVLLFSLLATWRTLLREYAFELCLC